MPWLQRAVITRWLVSEGSPPTSRTNEREYQQAIVAPIARNDQKMSLDKITDDDKEISLPHTRGNLRLSLSRRRDDGRSVQYTGRGLETGPLRSYKGPTDGPETRGMGVSTGGESTEGPNCCAFRKGRLLPSPHQPIRLWELIRDNNNLNYYYCYCNGR
jgi:hypothetical protein